MNIFDLQNIPTLKENERATVGIPSKRFFSENGKKYIERWNGSEWLKLMEVNNNGLLIDTTRTQWDFLFYLDLD